MANHLLDMVLWLSLGSSLTLVIVLALVTKYYRAKFIKQSREKQRRDVGLSLEEQLTSEDLAEEQDPRYSTSSASLQLDQSPYRDQLDQFLATASRESRKSRI